MTARLPPKLLIRAVLAAVLLVGFVSVFFARDMIDHQAVAAYMASHSWWEAALVFLFVHLVASLFFVPRLILGIAAGAVFGAWGGTLLGLLGGLIGAVAGFLAVRMLNEGAVRLRETPAIGQWLERAERYGWRLVMLVRLVPLIPHSLVNYVFGLSQLSLTSYMAGSAVGMIPTAVVYANLGASGRALTEGTGDVALLMGWTAGLILISWVIPRALRRFLPGAADRKNNDAG